MRIWIFLKGKQCGVNCWSSPDNNRRRRKQLNQCWGVCRRGRHWEKGDAGNNVKHPPFLSCVLISLCPCLLEFPQRMLQLGERDRCSLSYRFLSCTLPDLLLKVFVWVELREWDLDTLPIFSLEPGSFTSPCCPCCWIKLTDIKIIFLFVSFCVNICPYSNLKGQSAVVFFSIACHSVNQQVANEFSSRTKSCWSFI